MAAWTVADGSKPYSLTSNWKAASCSMLRLAILSGTVAVAAFEVMAQLSRAIRHVRLIAVAENYIKILKIEIVKAIEIGINQTSQL